MAGIGPGNRKPPAPNPEDRARLYKQPTLKPMSEDECQQLSDEMNLGANKEEVKAYTDTANHFLSLLREVDEHPDPPLRDVKYPRTPGHPVAKKDNPYNAWKWRCDVNGAPSGPLSGRTIAIKDNIAVAGVPLGSGSALFEAYTPEFDATVVTRILDAGGKIVGKTVCSDLSADSNSFTSRDGPVSNPWDLTRSSGGSSSGSAALVAAGEVDMALGTDTGGSVRIPSALNGCVGLKVTYGLVPYTGIVDLIYNTDTCGPIARTVQDVAILLEVLAGYDDGNDPKQHPGIIVPRYSQSLTKDLSGVKIGILEEGFAKANADVKEAVLSSAMGLTKLGATVDKVSFPYHVAAWGAVMATLLGSVDDLYQNYGCIPGTKGWHKTTMHEAWRRGAATRSRDMAHSLKWVGVAWKYLKKHYGNRYYAKGMNQVNDLRRRYDEFLSQYDALILPTVPFVANKLPTVDDDLAFICSGNHINRETGAALNQNTWIFNCTGHPMLTINCAFNEEGMPVPMGIVGKFWNEEMLLKIAYAFECQRDGVSEH